MNIKTSLTFSNCSLVWRDEDGGTGALDNIDPATGKYSNCEVKIEDFNNSTTEIRLLHDYNLLNDSIKNEGMSIT